MAWIAPVAGLASGVFGQKEAERKRKLANDLAEASASPVLPNQDYLTYRAFHGDNVTRYEYDNLRRPYEQQSPHNQYVSGLYPVTWPSDPGTETGPRNSVASPGAGFIGPPEPPPGTTAQNLSKLGKGLSVAVIGVIVLVVVLFAMRKGKTT